MLNVVVDVVSVGGGLVVWGSWHLNSLIEIKSLSQLTRPTLIALCFFSLSKNTTQLVPEDSAILCR